MESETESSIRAYCLQHSDSDRSLIPIFAWYSSTTRKLNEKVHPLGVILYIRILRGLSRTYSVPAIYFKLKDAKLAVAELACSQGVAQFIADYGGLTKPGVKQAFPEYPSWDYDDTAACSLEEFKGEVRAMAQLMGTPLPDEAQLEDLDRAVLAGTTARGNALAAHYFTNQNGNRAYLSLALVTQEDLQRVLDYGCLLRCEFTGSTPRSWLAEPIFASQKDAKAAVSIVALYSGDLRVLPTSTPVDLESPNPESEIASDAGK